MLASFAAWLKGIFEQLAQFAIDTVFLILGWIWSAFIALLDTLGIAEQVQGAAHAFDSIPDSVWYFMNMFEIQFGLGLIMSAYGLRFFIRRLPVVG